MPNERCVRCPAALARPERDLSRMPNKTNVLEIGTNENRLAERARQAVSTFIASARLEVFVSVLACAERARAGATLGILRRLQVAHLY